ncbi:VIT1/CCC1 transporter family protein [Corynebacterium heidelbergense]|uniref:Rubrerythrin family protein n=1 Tax=Corynebacterium heidelbergense TaxID=2055947 RepID=A0A364VDQ7_9CORY|nr:VIT1/CCC1 transporter family protein [Corynebacterium heidelbergense]RAV34696.1 rubrerythrin family protein [Corynebacterium heidelbergense]
MHRSEPTRRQINRWRQYLANERAEGALYREIARKRTGEEREILLSIAEAESRHEAYWRNRLGEHVGLPRKASLGTRMMAWMAKRFGTFFVLALMQSAEARNKYVDDVDASDQIAADEAIHAEIVRGLAARGRARMSGDFRAAVFGANDGLVSNLALVLGMVGSGASAHVVLVTGLAGLLAGALSMAAGEYVSVTSQQELLAANRPDPEAAGALPKLDVQANELELVYRARGMTPEDAQLKAQRAFEAIREREEAAEGAIDVEPREEDHGGSGLSAALSSFLCFGVGALIPVLPYIFGASGAVAAWIAGVLVSLALLFTGATVGLLSGVAPGKRALRQLLIGIGAAGVTFGLGSIFNVSV